MAPPEETANECEPPDTALRQQRIKGYHPILDPTWTIYSLGLVGLLFLAVGEIHFLVLD